jgi:hypothetical protein
MPAVPIKSNGGHGGAHVSCTVARRSLDHLFDPDRGVVPIMTSLLRTSIVALALTVSAACGQRQVEVRTAPTPTTGEQTVTVTNNLSQAVNVYVTTPARGELFLRQIPANTVEKVAVPGVAAGTNVTFKAVTVDGSRTYQSRNAPLSGTFAWSVP